MRKQRPKLALNPVWGFLLIAQYCPHQLPAIAHPHRAGRGWIVHNGVVCNYRDLIGQYDLRPETECDSEVLSLLIGNKFRGSIGQRAAITAQAAVGSLALLGLWAKPLRLLVVRNGNPLSFSRHDGGLYFASLSGELPGAAKTVADGYAGVFRVDGAKVSHEAYIIGDTLPGM